MRADAIHSLPDELQGKVDFPVSLDAVTLTENNQIEHGIKAKICPQIIISVAQNNSEDQRIVEFLKAYFGKNHIHEGDKDYGLICLIPEAYAFECPIDTITGLAEYPLLLSLDNIKTREAVKDYDNILVLANENVSAHLVAGKNGLLVPQQFLHNFLAERNDNREIIAEMLKKPAKEED